MKEPKKKLVKIALFGHFGQYNFGNETTLQAMLHHLRRRVPDAEITCICTRPDVAARAYGIRAIQFSRAIVKPWTSHNPFVRLLRKALIGIPSEFCRWFMAFKMLLRTDIFIVPGTGLLTDAFGLAEWGPYNAFKWCLIARLCRCRLFFVSVGAGPLSGVLGRFFVKSALSYADFRSYRDESTLKYLNSIGFQTNGDRVYPDLAFSLPKADMPNNNVQERSRPVVGLGMMHRFSMYGGGGRPTDECYALYIENLALFTERLLACGYDIRLLIGDLGDRSVTREFKNLLRERIPAGCDGRVIDEPACSAEELLTQLTECDFVVATRFHNVLLALLLNKPVISISFHQKCTSLMSAMGLSEYCQDIKELNADQLMEQFREMEVNAGKLKRLIKRKTEESAKALDEQYDFILRDSFGSVEHSSVGGIQLNDRVLP